MQKISNLLHRNSDKNLNQTTTAPVGAAPVAAPVARSYEIPSDEPLIATAPGLTTANGVHNQGLAGAHHNPLDRNHDGRVDAGDLRGNQGLAHNQGVAGAHHNPLDRNHDGRVDAGDLRGNQGLGHNQGLAGAHHNPLDRNHDGRVDAADLSGQQHSTYIQSERRASLVRAEPTIIETIQKDVVVHERIHPVEKEEIQPIIYREREQLDVKQVTQMMHETMIQPTLVQQRELPAERREAVVERGAPIQENVHFSTTERDATLRTQQIHAPIIEEVIKKTIIEEVQPVLERDVFVPTIVQNTQPIYEKIVEAPVVYREVRTVQELGTREVFAPAYVEPAYVAPIERAVEPTIQPLQVVPITTTTTVETYDHKLNPIETRDFIGNRGLPLR